jgi:hypothetical protein
MAGLNTVRHSKMLDSGHYRVFAKPENQQKIEAPRSGGFIFYVHSLHSFLQFIA